METFLVTFIVMMLFIAAMSVGVMFKRAPIKGSCGGVGRIKGVQCEGCSAGGCEKKKAVTEPWPEDK